MKFSLFFLLLVEMRTIVANQTVKIPDDVEVTVKKRIVTVVGKRGKLERSFRHLAVDIYLESKKVLKVEKWFGTKKELAAVRTVCTHVENMIKGVKKVGIFFIISFILIDL